MHNKTITHHAPYLKPLIKQGRWMDDDLDLSFEPANPNAIDPLLSVSFFYHKP